MTDTTTLVVAERVDAEPVDEFALDSGNTFTITPQTPPDTVAAVINAIDRLKERFKELTDWRERAVTEWVKANGPLTFGPFKWYVGDVTKVEWTDIPGALDIAFAKSGGDWETFSRDFLASNPLKHGSFEEAVGEDMAAKFFRRVKGEELKDNVATVKKKLQKVDTRFIK